MQNTVNNDDKFWMSLVTEFYTWCLTLDNKSTLFNVNDAKIPAPEKLRSNFDYYIKIINKIRANPYELYEALRDPVKYISFFH